MVVAGVEVVDADPVQFGEGPAGADGLVGQVGVADVGGGEPVGDDGFDDGGEDADGDVASDAGLRSSGTRAAARGSLSCTRKRASTLVRLW